MLSFLTKEITCILFIGLDEELPRALASFDFVCHAKIGLYKTASHIHPPYQRSQTNLDNLIYAANSMKDATNVVEKNNETKNS